MKKYKVLGLIAALMFVVGTSRAELAILTPVNSKTGHSDIIPLKDARKVSAFMHSIQAKGVIDTISYFDVNSFYIYSGIDVGDTMVEWFKSVAACSLQAAYMYVLNKYTANSQAYFFVSGVPDSLAPVFDSTWYYGIGHHWYDYHFGASYSLPPGPSPIAYDSVYYSTTVNVTGDTLFLLGNSLPNAVDVGTKPFLVGFTPLTDGSGSSDEPWAIISAGAAGNNYGYHALVYQQDFGSSFPGASPGWYANWHTYWAYAIVNIYENPAPFINSVTKLPWTYDLDGPFTIQADLNDFGVPSDSSGVAYAELEVWVGSDATDTLHIPMTLVSGDSTAGIWQAVYTPSTALNVGDTVFYTVMARDVQGAESYYSHIYFFSTLQQTTNQILYVLDAGAATRDRDVDFASVFQALGYQVDVYDAYHWGSPDATVLLGQGGYSQPYQMVFWTGWGSGAFAADTALIAQYLDNGGKLVISDEDFVVGGFGLGDYGQWTDIPEGSFLYNYLKIASVFDDYVGTSPDDGGYTANSDTIISLTGEATNPVGQAFANDSITLYPYAHQVDSTTYGSYNYVGAVINNGEASDAFYMPDGTPTAITYNGTYRAAVLYWPFTYLVDSVTVDTSGAVTGFVYDQTRTQTLMSALINFLTTGVAESNPTPVNGLKLAVRNNLALNGKVSISFAIPTAGKVDVSVFDASGRKVTTLFSGNLNKAGLYTTHWNADGVRPGVYFVRLQTNAGSLTKKAMILK